MGENERSVEAQSVRGLDEWKPAPPSGREFKYFKPPPTERLYLNLDRVGNGKSKEQQKEFQEMREWQSSNRLHIGSNRSNQEVSSINVKGSRNNVGSGDVIISDLKRAERLQSEEKETLKSQLKVLERISARCKGPNEQAQKILSLFRECSPDEFGFVSKKNFVSKIAPLFELSKTDTEKLFQAGQKNEKSLDEMNYLEFREAFKRLDRSTTFHPDTYRPLLNRAAAPKNATRITPGEVQSKSLSAMTKDERQEYRYRNKLHELLEGNRKRLQDNFARRVEKNTDNEVYESSIAADTTQHGRLKEVYVRTKLTYPEVSAFLKNYQLDISPDTVRKLYQKTSEENGLTYSQLYRRTEEYFSDLEGKRIVPKSVQNMELRGLFLGCRGVPTKDSIPEGRAVAPSEFLAHHNTPRNVNAAEGTTKKVSTKLRRKRRGGRFDDESNIQQQSSSRDQYKDDSLWKARWTEKVLDHKPRKFCGDFARKQVQDVSEKMYRGSGNFLEWGDRDSQENHPLGTGRSSLWSFGLESGRLETGRTLDTGRTSITSSAPILSTPFATDRDL